jgi:hypothetical protein
MISRLKRTSLLTLKYYPFNGNAYPRYINLTGQNESLYCRETQRS